MARGARGEPLFGSQADGALLLLRLVDTWRLIPMLFGALGNSQGRDAHVVFRPTEAGTQLRLMGLRPIDLAGLVAADNPWVPDRLRRWIEARATVDQGSATSVNLNRAVNQAKDAWRRLLRNAPSRAWIDEKKKTIEIEQGYAIVFKDGSEQLDPSCFEILGEVAHVLKEPEVGGITVRVRASNADLGLRRAERVRLRLAGLDVDVKDGRVKVVGAEDGDGVDLVDLVLLTADDTDRLRQELGQVTRAANAGKLRAAAITASVEGDPDLARLLALEASALDRGVETDTVLRAALLLRGQLTRALPGVATSGVVPGVSCLAWHPSPDAGLLAIGDAYGRVRIVNATSGVEVTAERQHRHEERESTARVQALAWSADGSLIASVGDDGRILVHALGDGPAAAPTLRCEADAGTWLQWGVAFSPRGDRLLATCPPPAAAPGTREVAASACVGIWTVSAGALTVGHLLQHAAIVRCAAWSPDGELAAVGDESGAVSLWSAADGALRRRFQEGGRFTAALAWFVDPERGRRLAVAREAEATVYDVDGSRAPITLVGHRAALSMIAWSPGGELLVTSAADHTARIWDARTGALRMVVRWSPSPLVGAAWHPGGGARLFVTWSECGKAQAWDALSGELLGILSGQRAPIRDAMFSPLGDHLATGSKDGSTYIWGAVEPVPVLGPFGVTSPVQVNTVAWGRPGMNEVLATAFDGAVMKWSPRDASLPGASLAGVTLLAPAPRTQKATIGSPVASASLSFDGRLVAATQRPDRSPHLFDQQDPTRTKRLGPASEADLPEHPAWDISYPVSWSADDRCLAVNYGRSAAIWDVVTGERLLVLVGPKSQPETIDDDCIRGIAWHPTEGRRFAVARWSRARSVEIRTLGETEPLRCGDEPAGWAWQVAWSPDGSRLAAAHHDRTARVYDAATGRVLHTLAHDHPVGVIAWRPDGNALATGDFAGCARIWERRAAAAGAGDAYELASEGVAQPGNIRVVVWSPDGRRMLSCGDGASAAIWRAEDAGGVVKWKIGARLRGHRASIGAAAFHPGGEHVATGSDDGTVRVEPATFDALVARVAAQLGRTSLNADEWKQYLSWAGERRPTWPRR